MALATEDRTEVARAAGRRPARLPALDGLRLLCALAVAGYHFGDSWRLDGVRPPAHFLPDAAPVLIYGFLGVEVFFLISGFVICMSGWGRTVRGFAASRVARLYPAFWFSVIATAVVVALLPITAGLPVSGVPTVRDVAVNLTMLAEPLNTPLVDTVYWTLWVELRFYLIVACLIGAGLTDRRLRLFGTGWLIAAVVMPAFPDAPLQEIVMPGFAPYFIAGMTMFLLRRSPGDRRLWVLLAGCWLVSLQRVEVRALDLKPGFVVPVWPAMVLLTIAYAVLLAIALGVTDRLDWRWLGTAGALTYPFYLLHQRIGYSLIRTAHAHTGLPAWALITGAVCLLLAASWVVHRLVERPIAPLLRRRILGRRRTFPDATGSRRCRAGHSTGMNRSTDRAAAFRELYQATYDDLWCFVERRVHLAVADDVVAEVFVTAWRRFADVPVPPGEARAWLFTVAHNMLRNRHRSDSRQQGLALRILREPATGPGAEADGVAARVDLVRAWQRLSPDDQQVLTLTVFEDLTGPQAARVLGISRPAFSLRLLRARRRLRRLLHPQPETAPAVSAAHPTTTTEIGTVG